MKRLAFCFLSSTNSSRSYKSGASMMKESYLAESCCSIGHLAVLQRGNHNVDESDWLVCLRGRRLRTQGNMTRYNCLIVKIELRGLIFVYHIPVTNLIYKFACDIALFIPCLH